MEIKEPWEIENVSKEEWLLRECKLWWQSPQGTETLRRAKERGYQ